MRDSYGERKIYDVLTTAEMDFEEEYFFKDLVSPKGVPLRFDFAVFDDDGDLDFLIEYQGEQHYAPKSIFGGMAGLRKQQLYDMMKREFCKKHNLTLLVIPYTDEHWINYNYIISRVHKLQRR